MGIGLADLVQGPVLDLENHKTNIIAVEQEIRLLPVHIREIPGHVSGIRPGNRPEEPKKNPLALGLELLYIIWNHGCRELINPDTNPSSIRYQDLPPETLYTRFLPEYPQKY